ncbi:MAG TPA: c(7)-type cytochrome triheme domain-containing protein [Pelovirga sp.]|nr:c(7)-type cytochrome triheme domain-containing protein [Pelovirga sp.]
MKRIVLLLCVVTLCAVTAAIAVPANRSLNYDRSALGPVEFSGKIHAEAGFSCGDCHNPDLFPKMKQRSVEITMEKIYAGEQCGFCHNGETAFAAKTSCNRCHVK